MSYPIFSRSGRPKLNWTAVLFIGITHPIGLIGWPLYCYFNGAPQWQEVSVFFFMYLLAVLGINFGYHRAFTHKSFEMSVPMKFITLVAASSTAENSALCWCSDHRRHHRYQDTDRDPYNINKGFWWAHMGWIFAAPPAKNFNNCPDLLKDPLLRNQDRYYLVWLILSAFGLPLALGWALGRPWETLLLAGFTRLMLVNQFTYLVNSWAHYFGKRPYDTKSTARDSLVVAVLASGEGYHNFHHRFPFDFRNGHRWYHWDPTKWMIYAAKFFGQAWNLKETPAAEIYRARIQAEQSKLKVKNPKLDEMSELLESALAKWRALSYEWHQLRISFDRESREQIRVLHARVKEAKREFEQRYQEWKDLQLFYQTQMA